MQTFKWNFGSFHRWAAWFAIACLGLGLASCVPSLNPIYTEADLIFENDLLGVWTGEDGDETWQFTKMEDNSLTYRLVYMKDDDPGVFRARLAEIKGEKFLNVRPEKPEISGNAFYKSLIVRAHTFFWVRQIQPTLKLSVMNPNWLEDYLEENPKALPHEFVNDRLVITASSKALQAFVLKRLETEEAFRDPSNLRKLFEPAS